MAILHYGAEIVTLSLVVMRDVWAVWWFRIIEFGDKLFLYLPREILECENDQGFWNEVVRSLQSPSWPYTNNAQFNLFFYDYGIFLIMQSPFLTWVLSQWSFWRVGETLLGKYLHILYCYLHVYVYWVSVAIYLLCLILFF